MSKPQPTELNLHRQSRVLEIAFDDGAHFNRPCEYLRVFSPSAEVQGHSPEERKLVVGKEEVNVDRIEPVGNYAVLLHFDDGHNALIEINKKLARAIASVARVAKSHTADTGKYTYQYASINEVLDAVLDYAEREVAAGTSLRSVTRHLMGLYSGLPGARAWRRQVGELVDGARDLGALRRVVDERRVA